MPLTTGGSQQSSHMFRDAPFCSDFSDIVAASDMAVEVDPFHGGGNKIRRSTRSPPGYAAESAAIEILLDQPRKRAPLNSHSTRGAAADAEQDLPDLKTLSTVSSTESPPSTYRRGTLDSRRKSFRDRFMPRKPQPPTQPAVVAPVVPDTRAKTTKSFRNQPVVPESVSSTTTLEESTGSPPPTEDVIRPRSRSVGKRALAGRRNVPRSASPDEEDHQKNMSQAKEAAAAAPAIFGGRSIHKKAKALAKRAVCGPKANDDEYEASLNVLDPSTAFRSPQQLYHPQPPAHPLSPTAMEAIPSPVSTPASRQLAYHAAAAASSRSKAVSPQSPAGAASQPSQKASRGVRPSTPATAHPAAASPLAPTSQQRRRDDLGDRKPSSIEMNRYSSHVSELSLPVLRQRQKQGGQLRAPRASTSSQASRQTSLAEESVAAVRNILSQVEDELQQGVPRQDILAQLQSLAATLEEQLEREQEQRRRLKQEQRRTNAKADVGDMACSPVEEARLPRPPQSPDQRSVRKHQYVELVLNDPHMGDVPFESEDDDEEEDDDDEYDTDDVSSATGTRQERGALDDDQSEFTKWMEEIENEEGGVAKESLNFLLGLFNFSSLMVPRIEEDEFGADESCESSTTGGSLSLFPPRDPNGKPAQNWTTSSRLRGETATVGDDSFGGANDAWWVDDDEPAAARDDGKGLNTVASSSQPATALASSPPAGDDGADDTLSLSSIESHQYSKEESLQPQRGRNSHQHSRDGSAGRLGSANLGSALAVREGKRTEDERGGRGDHNDYDQMWGSIRSRRRSRSLRAPFRSRSRGSSAGRRRQRRVGGGRGRSSAAADP